TEGIGRIDFRQLTTHGAVVDQSLADVETALHRQSVTGPGVHLDQHAVVPLRPRPEVIRVRYHVVDLAILGIADVIKITDDVPATTGQTRICWSGDAEA